MSVYCILFVVVVLVVVSFMFILLLLLLLLWKDAAPVQKTKGGMEDGELELEDLFGSDCSDNEGDEVSGDEDGQIDHNATDIYFKCNVI